MCTCRAVTFLHCSLASVNNHLEQVARGCVPSPVWLQVLGSVGEPINSEAWKWYSDVVGNGRCADLCDMFYFQLVFALFPYLPVILGLIRGQPQCEAGASV